MLKLRFMTKISFLCLIVILILCGNLFARVNDLIISGTLIDKSGLPIEKKKIYLFKYADIGRLFLSASVRRVTPFDITDSDGKFKITADNSFIEGSTYFALAQYKSNKTEIITKSGFPIKFNIRDELNVYKKSDLVIDIGIIIFENGIPSHTKEKAPKTEDASIIKEVPLTIYYESIGEIKARELYLLLISKGMKRKYFSEGLAPGSSKTIYYKKEYIEAAQWLKANVNELNSYQIKEGIGATGLYINLW